MLIGVDARFYGPIGGGGLGRYTKELVDNLERIDNKNQYVIFLRRENWDDYKSNNPNFKKILAPFKWYSLEEQIFMPFKIWKAKVDLMHFPHFNTPILYVLFTRISANKNLPACPPACLPAQAGLSACLPVCLPAQAGTNQRERVKNGFILTIHDLILLKYPSKKATTLAPIYFKLKFWAYKIVISLALKKAKKIIVPSEYVKNDIIKYFKIKTDKIEVIYEGVAKLDKLDSFGENKFIPLRECEAEKKKKLEIACLRRQGNCRACRQAGKLEIGQYILYVGNAYPHKNLERLLRAFSMMIKNDEPQGFAKGKRNWKFPPKADPPLAEEIGNLKLVLVGVKNDFYERLEKYAEENFLDLTGKLIFFGYATDRELAEFYKNAALYVFPSLEEGFGLPPLEAMSYGIPVISSKSSCLPEILGDAALYFNAEDTKDMSEKILRGIKDEKLREELVKKGYERIKLYDWAENARRTIKMYIAMQ